MTFVSINVSVFQQSIQISAILHVSAQQGSQRSVTASWCCYAVRLTQRLE